MTGLGLGLENLVGLIAIFEGNENTVSSELNNFYIFHFGLLEHRQLFEGFRDKDGRHQEAN